MNIISYLSEYDRDLRYEEDIILTISILDATLDKRTKYTLMDLKSTVFERSFSWGKHRLVHYVQ